MKTIKGKVRTDKQGSDCEFVTNVEDGATQEDIDEAVRDAALEYVEYWVETIEETDDA